MCAAPVPCAPGTRDPSPSPRPQLPAEDERAFWAAPETQQRLLSIDLFGLVTGLLINLLLARFLNNDSERARNMSHTRFFPLVAFFMQCAQLAWLCLAPRAYLRHRQLCQLLQRTQRLLQSAAVYFLMPTQALGPWVIKGASRDNDSGLHKLLVLLLLNPMTAFLNAANHTLRFKHQVCSIVW
jgi:hypothetical protein